MGTSHRLATGTFGNISFESVDYQLTNLLKQLTKHFARRKRATDTTTRPRQGAAGTGQHLRPWDAPWGLAANLASRQTSFCFFPPASSLGASALKSFARSAFQALPSELRNQCKDF